MKLASHMTLGEASSWIAARDDTFSQTCRDLSPIATELQFSERGIGRVARAESRLLEKCRTGRIVATGFRGNFEKATADKRTRITEFEWIDLRTSEHAGLKRTIISSKDGTKFWYEVTFKRAHVIDQFPILPPSQKEKSPSARSDMKPSISFESLQPPKSRIGTVLFDALKEAFAKEGGVPKGAILSVVKERVASTTTMKTRGLSIQRLLNGSYDTTLKRLLGRTKK